MKKFEVAERLFDCFPDSFINDNGEFIAHEKANEYFNFENCETELDVKCKVLEWFSRGAYKSEPFDRQYRNLALHGFMLDGINDFLGTNFTKKDMDIIYTYLGNSCNRPRTIEFIESGYDMTFFNQFREQMALC